MTNKDGYWLDGVVQEPVVVGAGATLLVATLEIDGSNDQVVRVGIESKRPRYELMQFQESTGLTPILQIADS